MPAVKILHTADIHIGASESFLGIRAKSRRAETLITFEKTVELARNEKVSLFLIAGDLFDNLNDTDYSVISDVFAAVSSAPEIRFVYAAGNHDPLTVNSPFRKGAVPSNLFVLNTTDSFFTFDDLKVRVYGRSFKEVYDNGEEKFSILPLDDNYVNIMCIHGELTSDKNSNYNPIIRQFIEESKMDYIALGHIHKCTDIGKIGTTSFAYCGCLEGQGFDESGKKGVLLGSIGKNTVNLSFVPVSLRTHNEVKISVDGCVSNTEIADKILRELKDEFGDKYGDNLYKIVLTGKIDGLSVNTAEISARLGETLYYSKIKDKTELSVNYELLSNEPSLKGVFVKKMLEKINKSEDENEKQLLNDALCMGLKAFETEVSCDED